MATESNPKLDKAVVAILKKDMKPGERVDAMVDAGVPRGQVSAYLYRLEHVADPSLVIPTNGGDKAVNKRIVAARHDDKLRWERIAARSGLSVREVKERYEAATGTKADESYVGRGRNFTGVERKAAPATSGRRGAKAKKEEATATSGRRRGAKDKETAGSGNGRRRGTRGQKDPS